MIITTKQINKMKEMYNTNKEELNRIEAFIDEYGCTDDGLTDVSESFEQGWNNAMELVFDLLGIKYKTTVDDIKSNPDYQFGCDITNEYKNETDYDEWGCACILVDDIGVEYNFCIDGGENCCAIYKMDIDDEGYLETDYNTFVHYEIDFNNKHWKDDFENAMCKALIEFFNL